MKCKFEVLFYVCVIISSTFHCGWFSRKKQQEMQNSPQANDYIINASKFLSTMLQGWGTPAVQGCLKPQCSRAAVKIPSFPIGNLDILYHLKAPNPFIWEKKSSWFLRPQGFQCCWSASFVTRSWTEWDRQTDRLQMSHGLWLHNLQAKKKCHDCDLQNVWSFGCELRKGLRKGQGQSKPWEPRRGGLSDSCPCPEGCTGAAGRVAMSSSAMHACPWQGPAVTPSCCSSVCFREQNRVETGKPPSELTKSHLLLIHLLLSLIILKQLSSRLPLTTFSTSFSLDKHIL